MEPVQDPLAIACASWLQSPHGGYGTLIIRLSVWYGKVVGDVIGWEE